MTKSLFEIASEVGLIVAAAVSELGVNRVVVYVPPSGLDLAKMQVWSERKSGFTLLSELFQEDLVRFASAYTAEYGKDFLVGMAARQVCGHRLEKMNSELLRVLGQMLLK